MKLRRIKRHHGRGIPYFMIDELSAKEISLILNGLSLVSSGSSSDADQRFSLHKNLKDKFDRFMDDVRFGKSKEKSVGGNGRVAPNYIHGYPADLGVGPSKAPERPAVDSVNLSSRGVDLPVKVAPGL